MRNLTFDEKCWNLKCLCRPKRVYGMSSVEISPNEIGMRIEDQEVPKSKHFWLSWIYLAKEWRIG